MRLPRYLTIWTVLLLSMSAGLAETYILAKITNFKGDSQHAVFSNDDFLKVSGLIRLEPGVFFQAQRLAEQEWRKANPGKSYPGKKLKPRTIKRVKQFQSRELANMELEDIRAKDKRWQEMKARRDVVDIPKNLSHDPEERRQQKIRQRMREEEQKQLDAAQDKREQKAAEKEALLDSAVSVLQKHVREQVKKTPAFKAMQK